MAASLKRRHVVRAWIFAGLGGVLVATIGSTITDLGPWYQGLTKPSWQPPDAAFPIAWTLIFALAVVSAATAWASGRTRAERDWTIGLFALNGALNLGWSFLFFRVQRPDLALIEVGILWLSILVLMIYVGRWSGRAAALLLPYLIWVGFAAALNWAVVDLNAPFG